jgi:hypothetical protein
MEKAEYKIITFDSENNQCWTNPPTKNINEVWQFIYQIFKNTYIKGFLFSFELKYDENYKISNNKLHLNPKKDTGFKQMELFS